MEVTLKDLVLLGAGALAGSVATEVIHPLKEYYAEKRRNRLAEQRQAFLSSGQVFDWLISYYSGLGLLSDLFCCKIGSFECRIPFLTKNSWCAPPQSGSIDDVIGYSESYEERFPVNDRIIRRRASLGQNLFNEPTIYLDRIEENGAGFKLQTRTCSYFQMFSVLAALEEETFAAARGKRCTKSPLRAEMCQSLQVAQKGAVRPVSVGCQVVLAVSSGDSYQVVVQTRSHSTVTFGGTKAAIPVFGLSPVPALGVPEDLLTYNILREFCEELFNYESLILEMGQRRPNPRWFYELPEAKLFIDLKARGQLTLELLGGGFDALNGSFTLAVLCKILDAPAAEIIAANISANWEVAEYRGGGPSIAFVPANSPMFEQWLRDKAYHFGSAFAFSIALQRLKAK